MTYVTLAVIVAAASWGSPAGPHGPVSELLLSLGVMAIHVAIVATAFLHLERRVRPFLVRRLRSRARRCSPRC